MAILIVIGDRKEIEMDSIKRMAMVDYLNFHGSMRGGYALATPGGSDDVIYYVGISRIGISDEDLTKTYELNKTLREANVEKCKAMSKHNQATEALNDYCEGLYQDYLKRVAIVLEAAEELDGGR